MPTVQLILLNKYYAPDSSATSQLLEELAQFFVQQGHAVGVVTSRQRYTDPCANLPADEEQGGIAIRRLWATRFGRNSNFGRVLDTLSFYLSLCFYLLFTLKANQVVICLTDPPLLSVPVAAIVKLKGAKLVNWLQDLYPEVAIELGVMKKTGWLTGLLLALRNWSLRVATRNVAIGERMAARLKQIVPSEAVATIHNWSDSEHIQPLARDENPLRQRWGLASKFVVGYSGNFGKAHDYQTLRETIFALREHKTVVFLLIGGGYYSQKLHGEVQTAGLSNVLFQPYQDKAQLNYSLTTADVHLLSLLPALEGCIVPSKFYAYAASGRPMIFIGSQGGEVGQMLGANHAGVCVEPGQSSQLVAAILDFATNPAKTMAMGRNARTVIEQRLNRQESLASWERLVGIFA